MKPVTSEEKRTIEYAAWNSMKGRVRNDPLYRKWNVTIFAGWLSSYWNFLRDVGRSPEGRRSLDRYPKSDGNYEPNNVRWATHEEQSENRRNANWITHDGQTLTLSQWSRKAGITNGCLSHRLRHGWSMDDALSTTPRPKRSPLAVIQDWADRKGKSK